MRVVITGLPQAGQQELFSIISGTEIEHIRQRPLEVQLGASEVRDPRVARLTALYKPKKTTCARVEYALLPDSTFQGTPLKNADEICYVVGFENAESDISRFVAELIIADMLLVEKRIETIDKEQRRKFSEAKDKEKGLMEICKKQLETEKPLSTFAFSEDQLKFLKTYQFLTLKPLIVAVNVPENMLNDRTVCERVKANHHCPCVQLSAKIEAEINELSENDRAELMKELGIDEPAVHKLNRAVFDGLGLIAFFTVGEDEVRAWPVRRGVAAAEAGGVIHSDIEKGFVRAEYMKYDDLINFGSEAKVKDAGRFSLKGRDYIVEDGDILSFRFNV